MPQASFDVIAASGVDMALPWRLEQRSSRASAAIRLTLLVPATAGLLVPLGLMAANAASVAAVVQQKPIAAVQLLIAAAIWIVLFILPTAGLVRRFGSRRLVTVDTTSVATLDQGPFGRRSTCRPLSEFSGICHIVRTSLSETRHELMLVDNTRREHVVFHTASRIGPEIVQRASRLLGLPEIAARNLAPMPTAMRGY